MEKVKGVKSLDSGKMLETVEGKVVFSEGLGKQRGVGSILQIKIESIKGNIETVFLENNEETPPAFIRAGDILRGFYQSKYNLVAYELLNNEEIVVTRNLRDPVCYQWVE